MRTLVILLTDNFPFDSGEEFLESEIPYLAEAADDVLIVPVRATVPAVQTRTLPSNVRCVLPGPPTRGRGALLARFGPRAVWSREGMVDLGNVRSPRRMVSDLMYAVGFLDVYDRVSSALRGIDFSVYASAVVYSYWFSTGVGVGRQLIRNELRSIPSTLISRGHRYDIEEALAWGGYLPCRRYFLRVSNRVCAISSYARRLIGNLDTAYSSKVVIRRLGVNGAHMGPRAKPNDVHLVSCSGLSPVKRVPLLLDALAELYAAGVTFRWTHLGGSEGEELDALRNGARVRMPNAEVVFTGHRSNSDVLAFLERPDVSFFVNVSSSEGVPVSIMEAQARGIPVLATAAGGTGEIVLDGQNGILIPVDSDAGAIAEAIRRAVRIDANTYESWSEHSRSTWTEKSDAAKQYTAFSQEVEDRLRHQASAGN